MCRKAGKLSMGMDMVKEACRNTNAFAVFIASDMSPKSRKEAKYVCFRNSVPLYELGMTMDEISEGIGKRTGVIAICDKGFAVSCAKGLEKTAISADDFYGI